MIPFYNPDLFHSIIKETQIFLSQLNEEINTEKDDSVRRILQERINSRVVAFQESLPGFKEVRVVVDFQESLRTLDTNIFLTKCINQSKKKVKQEWNNLLSILLPWVEMNLETECNMTRHIAHDYMRTISKIPINLFLPAHMKSFASYLEDPSRIRTDALFLFALEFYCRYQFKLAGNTWFADLACHPDSRYRELGKILWGYNEICITDSKFNKTLAGVKHGKRK